jgi:catechol 2,3-dioxygenase-like lactoylglutathione lyase family enzyme
LATRAGAHAGARVNGIDHLMSVVPDLAAAADVTRRLGFTVTDRGVHEGRGTSNHLIVLPGCYWELLAVDEPTPVNARVREALADPGLFGCALATHDVARDRLRTIAAGLPTDEPVQFERPVEIGGVPRIAGFRTAHIRPAEPFDGYFFFCEHLTPQFVWADGWMAHANGARGIVGADVAAAGPAAIADLLGRIFGASPAPAAETTQLRLDGLTIRVGASADGGSNGRFEAIRIAAADPETLSQRFVAEGFAPQLEGGSVMIEDPALGRTRLIFEPSPVR